MIQSNIYLAADYTPAICFNIGELHSVISSIIDRIEKLNRIIDSDDVPSEIRESFKKELDCLLKVESILWGLFPKINP